MIVSYARWIVRHPWSVALSMLLLALLAIAGMRFLSYSSDYRVFFSDQNPQLNAFEALQATYVKDDTILLVVSPRQGRLFERENLKLLQELTEAAWRLPYSQRVDSASNFQHTSADGDDLLVADLAADLDDISVDELKQREAVALAEPALFGRLISHDGMVGGINITLEIPEAESEEGMLKALNATRQMIEDFAVTHPQVDIRLTGVVPFNMAFMEASLHDLQTLMPLMFLLILFVLAVLLRDAATTVTTFLLLGLTVAATVGVSGYLGIVITTPTMIAPIVVLTLAVAHCVHLLVSFFIHLAESGDGDRKEAMVQAMAGNAAPIFLTSITTAAGFLSLNFSDVPPFQDLGNIAAIGMSIGFVLAMTLLPAVTVLLPVRVSPVHQSNRQIMLKLADFVIEQRKKLLWVGSLLVVLLISGIPANTLEEEFLKYFDDSLSFRTDTDYTVEHLTGINTIAYSIDSGSPYGLAEPEFLRKLDAFAQWYREQPEVMHVDSLSDVFRRLNRSMHNDEPQWYRLPESRDLASQYLLLYEISLPFGLDLNDKINLDKSATRLIVTAGHLTNREVIALENRAQAWLAENFPEVSTDGASPAVMFSHISQRNAQSMLIGTTVALAMISLILIAALRSWRLGLISLLPNLLPAAMTFGIWGLLVGQVGLAQSVITAMTMGIVVDDTVHFLTRYRHARHRLEMDPEAAIRYAFLHVGRALWVTSLVLVTGFMVLMLSPFALNATMGLMTAMTIAIALAADFLLLPPILLLLEKRRNEKVVAVAAV